MVERPLSPATTDCSWPIVLIRYAGTVCLQQPEAVTPKYLLRRAPCLTFGVAQFTPSIASRSQYRGPVSR